MKHKGIGVGDARDAGFARAAMFGAS